MENYEKTFRAHRAFSWFYGLVAALLLLVLVVMGKPTLQSGPLIMLFVITCGFFALHHFTARAALERKRWARIVSIVIGLLFLFAFPIGTIIGLLLLSYAWKPWVVTNA